MLSWFKCLVRASGLVILGCYCRGVLAAEDVVKAAGVGVGATSASATSPVIVSTGSVLPANVSKGQATVASMNMLGAMLVMVGILLLVVGVIRKLVGSETKLLKPIIVIVVGIALIMLSKIGLK